MDTHGTMLGPGRLLAYEFWRGLDPQLTFPHRSRQQRIRGLHRHVLVVVTLGVDSSRSANNAKSAKALVALRSLPIQSLVPERFSQNYPRSTPVANMTKRTKKVGVTGKCMRSHLNLFLNRLQKNN